MQTLQGKEFVNFSMIDEEVQRCEFRMTFKQQKVLAKRRQMEIAEQIQDNKLRFQDE